MNFGYGGNEGGTPPAAKEEPTNVTTGEPNPVDNPNDEPKNNGEGDDEPLLEGSTVELDGNVYTVDSNGNLVDKDNNIFKPANEVKDFLAKYETIDNNSDDAITVAGLQKALGYDLTDENGNTVSFEETNEGLTSYVKGIIETTRQEATEAAINTLYEKYPIVEDVLNYYIANGNSLEGFGVARDYSNIVIDENNEAQQESIIREAFAQRNQPGVENWIAYLKSQGTLAATAKEELNALNEAVEANKQAMADEARAVEEENRQRAIEYWTGVKKSIDNRIIAGYQIPETMVRVVNGQKVTVTPNDFFNYLYQVDDEGVSRYERDLANRNPDDIRDDQILRAYLTFVGGNYSSLVNMATNKKEVQRLQLKAKENTTKTIRITKPNAKVNPNKQTFGY